MRMTEDKIFQLKKDIPVIWGASGDVGLIQKVKTRLESLHSGTLRQPIEKLRADLLPHVNPLQKEAASCFIPNVGITCPTVDLLLCGYAGNKHWILHIARNGSDEQHEHRGFCAIGSGEVLAHYAFQSLRHLGINDNTLEMCKVVAYRVIDTAIAVAAYGLGPPVKMWTVSKDQVKCLSDDEVGAVASVTDAWKLAEMETLGGLFRPSTG